MNSTGYRGGFAGEAEPGAREERPRTALGQGHSPQPHLSLFIDGLYSRRPWQPEAPLLPQGASWPVSKQDECC